MRSLALEFVPWTRRRWICLLAAVFTVQLALVLFLGRRPQELPARPVFRTSIALLTDESSVHALAASLAGHNPTYMALPDVEGFSGSAWLRFPLLDYDPGERTEQPHWLGLDSNALGRMFLEYAASNRALPSLVADKALPPLTRYEPNYPIGPMPAGSRLQMQGGLEDRPLLAQPVLRSWPHSEILSNTVVEVTVSAEGFLISAVVLAECGWPEADRDALNIVRGLRFQPLSSVSRVTAEVGPLTWGRIVFYWHTLPLDATNHSADLAEP